MKNPSKILLPRDGENAFTTPSSPLLVEMLKIACLEIGVMEDPPGSNCGARVGEYLKSVGLKPGYAWCAGFVYWCFERAVDHLNILNPLVKTAGCLEHWNKTQGLKISSKEVANNPSFIQPGCVFIMSRGGGLGHTGIVKSVNDGYINTIEGNTNTGLSAEGGGVFELRRKIASVNIGFIKYC